MQPRKRVSVLIIALAALAVCLMMTAVSFAAENGAATTYKFKYHPGRTMYDGLENRMQYNLKTMYSNAWVTNFSGTYDVEITSDEPLTFKDVIGPGGALEKAYNGAEEQPGVKKLGIGSKASLADYKDSAALDEERNSEDPLPESGAEFYMLTASHLSVIELTVKAPACGDKVTYENYEIPTGAKPEVTIADDANYAVFTYEGTPITYWLNGDQAVADGVALKGDTEYGADIYLVPNFGYYFDQDTTATVNGEAARVELGSEDNATQVFASGIKAVHEWDEGTVTEEPTVDKEGVRTFTCKACGETKTEPIDKLIANTMKVSGKKATVKYSKLKKKAVTIARTKVIKVTDPVGAVSYKKVSGNKKITVSKAGKVTVKKRLKKGTYKVKVEVTAAGDDTHAPLTKTVTFRVRVK